MAIRGKEMNFFGIKLSTTGLVIGWSCVIISLLSFVLYGFCISFRLEDLTAGVLKNWSGGKLFNSDSIESKRRSLFIIISLYCTINMVNLIASALLIAGTLKERPLFFIPWLVNLCFSIGFTIIYTAYLIVLAIDVHAQFAAVRTTLLRLSLYLMVQFVVGYIVFKLFQQIKHERENAEGGELEEKLLPHSGETNERALGNRNNRHRTKVLVRGRLRNENDEHDENNEHDEHNEHDDHAEHDKYDEDCEFND